MSDEIGFVVVEFNQASHQPSVSFEDVYASLPDAVDQLAYRNAYTAKVGRKERHVIAVLRPCCKECGDEGELYDDGADGVCEECVMRGFAEAGW